MHMTRVRERVPLYNGALFLPRCRGELIAMVFEAVVRIPVAYLRPRPPLERSPQIPDLAYVDLTLALAGSPIIEDWMTSKEIAQAMRDAEWSSGSLPFPEYVLNAVRHASTDRANAEQDAPPLPYPSSAEIDTVAISCVSSKTITMTTQNVDAVLSGATGRRIAARYAKSQAGKIGRLQLDCEEE